MKKVFAKSLLVAAMFSVAGSALAVQKDITVTANVDAALDMTQTDIPAHKITLMIVCVGINSRALKITIFARQQRKVSLKLYNLALPALL
ncbi:hypothetical protein F6J46_12930 [Escherichia coli]|nr:hypothetical protein [Escherichia coli]EFD5336645.1 hypothetical protein [Escherichia coli]EFE7790629.1 hypothetical protein [Escherichia coli]EGT2322575.1 hypothetical protein [Escherichia coli]